MSSSYFHPRGNLRLVWNSQCQDRFVTLEIFELMKHFVSLPPSRFFILDQDVCYTIPFSQIVNGNHHSTYQIFSDFDLSESTCEQLTPLDVPRQFNLYQSSYFKSSVMGFLLHQETFSRTPFLLKHNASFSEVEVHSRIRQVINVFQDEDWIWDFREIHLMPYESMTPGDKFLYFQDPPRYQVTLYPPCSDISLIENFLSISLPHSLNRYS